MAIRILAALLGLLLAATALTQLFAPLSFYEQVPGVVATGPFNAHFVRDIGAAFLTAALGLIAFALRPVEARPALLAAASFLTLHAAIHLFDAVCGSRPWQDTARDSVGIHLVALIALGLAFAALPTRRPQGVRPC